MPALQLSNCNNNNNNNKQNGFQKNGQTSDSIAPDAGELFATKKKLLLETQDDTVEINNNNNGDNEEKFADVQTIGLKRGEEEMPSIFGTGGYEQNGTIETSIGRSAKDQFADALLRLQSDLHNTNERLSELATKVESKINSTSSSSSSRSQSNHRTKSSKLFNSNNVTTLFYFSWPVVVFFAFRALEKRSIISNK